MTTAERVNSLLRGELSAAETYGHAIAGLNSKKGYAALHGIYLKHRDAANALQEQMREPDEHPDASPGASSKFADPFERTAQFSRVNEALKALKELEEHRIKEYLETIEDESISDDFRNLILSTLLPQALQHVRVLDGLMAGFVERISAEQAHNQLNKNPEMLLVCAYDKQDEFQQNRLDGAIPLDQFKSRVEYVPKDSEIIFYCVCPNEATSAGVAEHYQTKGFSDVKALRGGADAWKSAGYKALPSN